MDMIGIFTILAGFFAMALLLRFAKVPTGILAMAGEDEDIKIAGGSFGNTPDELENAADEAAQEFLRHKQSGNIDKAGKLGEIYAEALWDVAKEMIMDEERENKLTVHHTIVLYRYVINKVVVDHSPAPLLAQTTLSIFTKRVEELSDVLDSHISDTGAITLYMLNDRNEEAKSIGTIYAGLCGNSESQVLMEEGNTLYASTYEVCYELFKTHANYVA